MTDPPLTQKKNGSKGSVIAAESKAINKDSTSKMIFFSGHKNLDNVAEFEQKLKSELLGQEDGALIEKVTAARRGTFVLHFRDKNAVTAFKSKYSGLEFHGGKIRLT